MAAANADAPALYAVIPATVKSAVARGWVATEQLRALEADVTLAFGALISEVDDGVESGAAKVAGAVAMGEGSSGVGDLWKSTLVTRLPDYHLADAPGFLRNDRLGAAAALGAIEMAQLVRHGWDNHRSDLGWRDVLQVGVEWRLVAAPGDAVFWADDLDASLANAGIGSTTCMVCSGGRNARYYGFAKAAWRLLLTGLADDPRRSDACADRVASAAASEAEATDAVGEEGGDDGLGLLDIRGLLEGCADRHDRDRLTLVLNEVSHAHPGRALEGAVLEIAAEDHGEATLSLRTIISHTRFEAFEAEMDALWHDLYLAGGGGTEAAQAMCGTDAFANAVWRLTYYWYVFMPLTRGTAGLGKVFVHALYGACGLAVDDAGVDAPTMHPDWTALFSPDADAYVATMRRHYDPLIRHGFAVGRVWTDSDRAGADATVVDVGSEMATVGARFQALVEAVRLGTTA